ncbi:MAG: PqqD family protein [Lachnospiraceae bacterium]|nr:PqqD family protein [Lachnospiraceae bacterium]
MKIKDSCLTHMVDDEYLMLLVSDDPEGFNGILRSNEDAQFIVECLREETTKEEILAKMQEAYEGDPEQMAKDIDTVIDNLKTVGALE